MQASFIMIYNIAIVRAGLGHHHPIPVPRN